jgi:ABC-type Fe3+/spermidine/putrescine transport system ATPase subunit
MIFDNLKKIAELKKLQDSFKKEKTVVDNLTLNFYENQITGLLGILFGEYVYVYFLEI